MKAAIFILFSLPMLWLSRHALKDPDRHGFYRFFVFEGLILLILLNAGRWFVDPFSIRQLFSWLFLIVSMYAAIFGFYWLRRAGKPEGSFENTTELVATGLYRYIRHPLYASLLYLGIGACLKSVTLSSVAICLAIGAFLYAAAVVEEKENVQHFGQAYVDYMRHTRMFIPWIF